MTVTRHGHDIPGSPLDGVVGTTKDCGGPAICPECSFDVQKYWANLQSNNEHNARFEKYVAEERERQVKKGYTIEHDQKLGKMHLLDEIRRRARDGKPYVQIVAMIDALVELLTYPEAPKPQTQTVEFDKFMIEMIVSDLKTIASVRGKRVSKWLNIIVAALEESLSSSVELTDINSLYPKRWIYNGKEWFMVQSRGKTDDTDPVFITPEDGEGWMKKVIHNAEHEQSEQTIGEEAGWQHPYAKTTQDNGIPYGTEWRLELANMENQREAPLNPRAQILRQAEELINGDRAQTYGDPAISFGRICDLWHALGFHKWNAEKQEWEDITPVDVALALMQLKVSRIVGQPDHADSWADAAGYTGLGWELADRQKDQS